ncbi:hypothetical protein ElyMa_004202700 [Elysia marginata]|uniref:Uncharacterized protein n=1 Tax=Elysia marginata TaxID=1093978 RepID=A0AAV4GQH3_9GAST|nr:hypothetical protein ElyMa_004202700 [Elysia marginata]
MKKASARDVLTRLNPASAQSLRDRGLSFSTPHSVPKARHSALTRLHGRVGDEVILLCRYCWRRTQLRAVALRGRSRRASKRFAASALLPMQRYFQRALFKMAATYLKIAAILFKMATTPLKMEPSNIPNKIIRPNQ